MRILEIQWLHYDRDGETCVRCSATGTTLADVVAELRQEYEPAGIIVKFTETALDEDRMPESNLILFNGVPLEALLPGAEATTNSCESCSCMTGVPTSCRTIRRGGATYDEIPEELIKQAAREAVRRMPAAENRETSC